jgi:antitoxin component of MazEF toxin-antitoxin module
MVQKVIKTGNSVALTIPSEFVHDLGIRVGDEVKTKFEKDKGRIVYSFTGVQQLPLGENFLHLSKKK